MTVSFYINLDRSVQRRRAIEAEIAKAGLTRSARRFRAIDGRLPRRSGDTISAGEAGCFLSHLGALEAGEKTGGHFHVMEDDTVLSRDFAVFLDRIASGVLRNFDIVLTDMLVPYSHEFVTELMGWYDDYLSSGAFTVIAGRYWACLSSYVVNRTAAGKLIGLLREQARSGLRQPVDLLLHEFVASGAVTVGCLFPFVSSIRLGQIGDTTILRSADTLAERLIGATQRAAFYVEADLAGLRTGLAAIRVADFGLGLEQAAIGRRLDWMLARRMAVSEQRRFSDQAGQAPG